MIDPILGELIRHGAAGEPLCPNCRRNVASKFAMQLAMSLGGWNSMKSLGGFTQMISKVLPKEMAGSVVGHEELAYQAVESEAQVRYLLGKDLGLLALLAPGIRMDLLKDVTRYMHKGCETLDRLESLRDRTKARGFKRALGEDNMALLLFWEQFVHGLVLRELTRLTAAVDDEHQFDRDMHLEKLAARVRQIQTAFKNDPGRFDHAEEKLVSLRWDESKRAEIDAMWEKRRDGDSYRPKGDDDDDADDE